MNAWGTDEKWLQVDFGAADYFRAGPVAEWKVNRAITHPQMAFKVPPTLARQHSLAGPHLDIE